MIAQSEKITVTLWKRATACWPTPARYAVTDWALTHPAAGYPTFHTTTGGRVLFRGAWIARVRSGREVRCARISAPVTGLKDPRKFACRSTLNLKEPMAQLFQGFGRSRLNRSAGGMTVSGVSHREDLELCELVVPAAKIVHRMKKATALPRAIRKITPLDGREHGVDGVFRYAFPLLLKRRAFHSKLPVHYLHVTMMECGGK